jgi:tetratricopeptide (TPR) repeat protein
VSSIACFALGRAGKNAEALAVVDEALRLHPDNDQLVSMRATVLWSRGDLPGAIALFEQVATRRPADSAPRFELGQLYLTVNDEAARKRTLDVVRSGAFAGPDAAYMLGTHALMLANIAGRQTESRALYDEAERLALSGGAWHVVARLRGAQLDMLVYARDWAAVAALGPTIDRQAAAPEMPQPMRNGLQIGRLRADLKSQVWSGDLAGARHTLERLEALDDSAFHLPRDSLLGFDRALVAAAAGNADQARAELAKGAIPPHEAVKPFIEAQRRAEVALLLKDRAGVLAEAAALEPQVEHCVRDLLQSWKTMCRMNLVTVFVLAAEAAHDEGDDARALALVDRALGLWQAEADAPMAAKARALRAELGR